MEITDVRIRKIESAGKLRAVASVTFDNMFVVHDMKVIEGAGGLFIAMPSRRVPNGDYKDIAHPTNAECRALIEKRILEEWENQATDSVISQDGEEAYQKSL